MDDKDAIEENHINHLVRDACKIFKKVIPIERNLIDDAIIDLIQCFKDFTFSSIDFTLSEYLFAYFEHYSTLMAASFRHQFSNAIAKCEKLETYVNMPELNVISLGAGPGIDMVGFCSVLQECREEPIELLNFCTVDKFKRWESFNDIIKLLLREKDYGNASKVFQKSKICTSFMEEDLMDTNPHPKYDLAVGSADIVVLARVLDSLNFIKERPQDMLHNIARRMKKDALLLLVDCGAIWYTDENLRKIFSSQKETFKLKDMGSQRANQSITQVAVFIKTE